MPKMWVTVLASHPSVSMLPLTTQRTPAPGRPGLPTVFITSRDRSSAGRAPARRRPEIHSYTSVDTVVLGHTTTNTAGLVATLRLGSVGQVTPDSLDDRLAGLQAELVRLQRVVVAFSGGADSAFLAAMAHRTLGPAAHAVTAVSPSLAGDEEADCRALAAEWGLRWTPVVTHEMERAAYRLNDTDRCFHCKAELMDVVGPIAAAERATVVLGVNLDDLGEHRPGQKAATEAGAAFPLVAAGLTKADVRQASHRLGLRTWDKPAMACLASRLPYGTEVSVGLLGQVDRAESALRRLGLRQLRVRHYGDTARLEVPLDDLAAVMAQRDAVVQALKDQGYRYVTLDLEGFRSGNLNG